jgi:Iron-sulfur cluster-binding domain
LPKFERTQAFRRFFFRETNRGHHREGHVTFDGRLSACCFDHDGRFDMGDLNALSFMAAWHSEPFRALRRANLAEDVAGTVCEKCLAYDECDSKPQPVTLMRRSEGAPM